MSKLPLVTFITNGNLGRQIIQLNFIKHFHERFGKDVSIRVLMERGKDYIDLLSDGQDFAEFGICPYNPVSVKSDCLVRLGWFPKVLRNRIRTGNKELASYIDSLKGFSDDPRNIFLCNPGLYSVPNASQYLLALGRKGHSSMDINGTLGIGESFLYRIRVPEKSSGQIQGSNGKYVTIVAPPKSGSTRHLQTDRYEDICRRIKERYADVTVIQMHHGEEIGLSCADEIVETDDLSVALGILDGSMLHIDSNGPYVHLRRALSHETSAVVYGPEDYRVWGYDSNINAIPSNKDRFFAYMYPKWRVECLGKDNPSIDTIDYESFVDGILGFIGRSI